MSTENKTRGGSCQSIGRHAQLPLCVRICVCKDDQECVMQAPRSKLIPLGMSDLSKGDNLY